MENVKSAQEILDYLRADLIITPKAHELIQEIEKLKILGPPKNKEAWTKLATRRILSSNTLQALENLEMWQKANDWVGKSIQRNESFGSCHLGTLNLHLTGEAGVLREVRIFTGDMEYLPPDNLEKALADFYDRLESTEDTFEKAFQTYLWLVTIHPFKNGNGRTARLAADWVLLAAGYLPLSFDSPVQSHVAVTLNHPFRNKSESYLKFLKGILTSYQVLHES